MTGLGCYPVLALGRVGRQVAFSASSLISYPSKERLLLTNISWDLCSFIYQGLPLCGKVNAQRRGLGEEKTLGKKKKSLNRQGETETERLPGVKSPKKDLLEVKDLYRLKRCQEMAEGSGEGVSPSSGYSQSCR